MIIMEIIDTSKVLIQNKITIKEPVAHFLNIHPGDFIAFLKSNSGDVVIRKLSDVEIKEGK